MKKTNKLFLGLVGLMLLSTSCVNHNDYPSEPYNGQIHVDANGNNCSWNSAMNCWMIMHMTNGHMVRNYYYPHTNTYRGSNGVTVIHRPSYVPATRVHTTYSTSYSTSSRPSVSTSSSSYRTSGFGSTGRSSSFGSSAS